MNNESNNKITSDISFEDILTVMSNGVPGAVSVLFQIFENTEKIDPEQEAKQIVLQLDKLSIYGSRIWLLYKDVCNEDLSNMIALIRAYQLGVAGINKEKIDHAIDNYGEGIDLDYTIEMVKLSAPFFNPK